MPLSSHCHAKTEYLAATRVCWQPNIQFCMTKKQSFRFAVRFKNCPLWIWYTYWPLWCHFTAHQFIPVHKWTAATDIIGDKISISIWYLTLNHGNLGLQTAIYLVVFAWIASRKNDNFVTWNITKSYSILPIFYMTCDDVRCLSSNYCNKPLYVRG